MATPLRTVNDAGSYETKEPARPTPGTTAERGVFEIVRGTAGRSATATVDRSEGPWNRDDALEIARQRIRALPEESIKALFREHSILVDQQLFGEFSRRDAARLTYVRWQLDRIEDARIGEQLDLLEDLANLQEAIASDIDAFAKHVEEVRRPPRTQTTDRSRRR